MAVAFSGSVHAQTHYEELTVDAAVQSTLSMGFFNKPYPLPPGQWVVASHSVKDLQLINTRTGESAGTVARHDVTLKNVQPDAMIPLMVISITGQRTTLEASNRPCTPSSDKNTWVTSLARNSASMPSRSDTVGCTTSFGISNFKTFVANAATSPNAWTKLNLSSVVSIAPTLPTSAVSIQISTSRNRGYSIDTIFFVRQEGNLYDPAYANHLKPWVQATGMSLLDAVENKIAAVNLPLPFAAGTSADTPIAIDNRVQSSLTDVVPLDAIQIPKKFDLVEVHADNFRAVLVNCLPPFANNSAGTNFPTVNVMQTVYKAANSSRQFILKKNTGLCLYSSSANFPIFAAQTLKETVKPVGVSDEQITQWNSQIAALIARQGRAYVAYAYPGKNVTVAKFWVDTTAPLVIHYSTQDIPQSAFQPKSFDTIFSDPLLSAVTTVNANASGEGRIDVLF